MAQYVMQDLVEKSGLADLFFIDSAATSTEEIGNPVDPRTRRKLQQEGIHCGNHRARQLTRADYLRMTRLKRSHYSLTGQRNLVTLLIHGTRAILI